MRHSLGVLLFAGATLLASFPAFGTASATVTVNGTTRSLSQTGFLSEQIFQVGVNLAPGQSSDFTFSYSISVTIFGGFAPFVATWLIAVTGDPLSPAYYLIATALLSIIALMVIQRRSSTSRA